jgi:NTE family protein
MPAALGPTDLVLSGGGVLGIEHVGAAAVLEEHGAQFKRIAGTSAGAIVGALLAAGAAPAQLHELLMGLDYEKFLDKDKLDSIPLVGPALSVVLENGYSPGTYLHDLIEQELANLGVKTFGDLRITDDPGADPRPEHQWRLTLMTADVTRGQLLRLPQDYERYGLDPDAQSVADAVRASTAVPYLYEPFRLAHAGGESQLVDGGLITNYPLDTFDRTDGQPGRWPTIGVTLIPQLPAGDTRLIPPLALLRSVPGFHFLESLVVTAIVGRDQGYLAQPWVKARSIEVDSLGVGPFDFTIDAATAEKLYQSGRDAATEWVDARP